MDILAYLIVAVIAAVFMIPIMFTGIMMILALVGIIAAPIAYLFRSPTQK